MSDDHHYAGGHELEGLSAGNLFKIIFGLALVTLLAATAVVQWFYVQRDELTLQRAAEGSPFLAAHREKVSQDLQGVDRVAERAIEDPTVLAAAAPPAGFIDPDGPAPAPAPAVVPQPAGDPAVEGAVEEGAADKKDEPAAEKKKDEPAAEKMKDKGADKEGEAGEKKASEKKKKDEKKKDEKKKDEKKKDEKDEG